MGGLNPPSPQIFVKKAPISREARYRRVRKKSFLFFSSPGILNFTASKPSLGSPWWIPLEGVHRVALTVHTRPSRATSKMPSCIIHSNAPEQKSLNFVHPPTLRTTTYSSLHHFGWDFTSPTLHNHTGLVTALPHSEQCYSQRAARGYH